MEAASDFAQLELRFVDQIQWRYELIRPLVLFENRPATQRAHETHTHPETVRQFRRRFQQQGMLGLLLDDVEVVPKAPPPESLGQSSRRWAVSKPCRQGSMRGNSPGSSSLSWENASATRPPSGCGSRVP